MAAGEITAPSLLARDVHKLCITFSGAHGARGLDRMPAGTDKIVPRLIKRCRDSLFALFRLSTIDFVLARSPTVYRGTTIERRPFPSNGSHRDELTSPFIPPSFVIHFTKRDYDSFSGMHNNFRPRFSTAFTGRMRSAVRIECMTRRRDGPEVPSEA